MCEMNAKDLINVINKHVNDLDLVSARKYIEENIDILNEKKFYLNSNARELLDFITKRLDEHIEPLTKKEKAAIRAINHYSTQFDIRSLKFCIAEQAELLMRKDIADYLNLDAKSLLQSMGAIHQDQPPVQGDIEN